MNQDTLSRIRILDLTRYLPGAFATQFFADLGADVIKIEETVTGDPSRLDPPKINGESYYFHAVNRNKKSLGLNLKTKEGKKIFEELSATADVIIENFRPGVTTRLGIDYQALKAIKPEIVYCSISGFGQENPKSRQGSHDINFLAASGFLDLSLRTGNALPAIFFADMAGSMYAVSGIAAALLMRRFTGKGQLVDVSLFDSFLSWHTLLFSRSYVQGTELLPEEMQYCGSALCYNVYETKDHKFMALGMVEPKFWEEFCESSGLAELRSKQFSLTKDEPEAWQTLKSHIGSKTQQEWIEWLGDKDLCMTPVKTLTEAMAENSGGNKGILETIEIPKIGAMIQTGFPLKFSAMAPNLKDASPPPELGQHSADLLQQIGYSPDEIQQFHVSGIICLPDN